MKLRRIFVDPKVISSGTVELGTSDTRYLKRVLRLKCNDFVRVFDGTYEYVVRLAAWSGEKAIGHIVRKSSPDSGDRIAMTLAVCCVRPAPLEEIFRHGTELGVTRFVPVLSSRCARKPQERKTRWQSIVAGAAAQAARVDLPVLESPTSLHELLARPVEEDLRMLLSLSPDALPMPAILAEQCPTRVTVLVGPEGGLNPAEEALTLEHGYKPASLAETILRTETAALVAVGLIAAWCRWRAAAKAASDEHRDHGEDPCRDAP
jgi:16S rRNA (uracil1498-N3)-methyltransferase